MNRSLRWAGLAGVAVGLGSAGCTVSTDRIQPVYATGGVQASYVSPAPVEVSLEPAAEAYADPGPVVYVGPAQAPAVEIDIGTYPHSDFGGRPVYFFRDHWYYRDGDRWAYYRNEPPVLYRQRQYVGTTPAARGQSRGVESAPVNHRAERAPGAHGERPAPVRRAPPRPSPKRREGR